jgi:hypothetical protein
MNRFFTKSILSLNMTWSYRMILIASHNFNITQRGVIHVKDSRNPRDY